MCIHCDPMEIDRIQDAADDGMQVDRNDQASGTIVQGFQFHR